MLKQLKYAICLLAIFYFFGPVSFDNKTLEPYKIEVMDIIHKHCDNSQYYNPRKQFLYFKHLTGGAVGECSINPWYYKVQIDPYYWKHFTEDEKFQVIFHEYTHCALLLNHVDNKNNYMYYMMVDLPKEVLIKQFLENVKLRCGK